MGSIYKRGKVYWIGASPDPDMDDPAEGWTKREATEEIFCPSALKERKRR